MPPGASSEALCGWWGSMWRPPVTTPAVALALELDGELGATGCDRLGPNVRKHFFGTQNASPLILSSIVFLAFICGQPAAPCRKLVRPGATGSDGARGHGMPLPAHIQRLPAASASPENSSNWPLVQRFMSKSLRRPADRQGVAPHPGRAHPFLNIIKQARSQVNFQMTA